MATGAYFRTFKSLVSSETPTLRIDTYTWHDGVVEQRRARGRPVATPGREGRFMGASQPDGARCFLQTTESLVAGDTDVRSDVYERGGGVTPNLYTGPAGGNGAFNVDLQQNAWTEDGYQGASSTPTRSWLRRIPTPHMTWTRTPAAARAWFPRERAARAKLGVITSDASLIFFKFNEQLVVCRYILGFTDLYERAGSACHPRERPTPLAAIRVTRSASRVCFARTTCHRTAPGSSFTRPSPTLPRTPTPSATFMW